MIKQSRNGNGKGPNPEPDARKNGSARRRSRAVETCPGDAGSPVLITGGAGFIGTNVAHHFLSAGRPVVLLDNFSRPGVERNVAWLRATHGSRIAVQIADIQNYDALRNAVRGAAIVFHFAAQVAVTTSLESPFHDFEVNARGTLNLLEALRELNEPPPLIFTSTNKVYGDLNDVKLRAGVTRYVPAQHALRTSGFAETRRLDFHSPYGCSKGSAEQYVLDYARTFRLPAVVFRMSCIYGPHQFGTEDQGWVAHFLIRALEGRPITVYGDGKQVRDVLFVEDLVEAFLLAQRHMPSISGKAFNLGGGPANTVSLLELIELIAELKGVRPPVRFDEWRPADQQYYVSDIRKFCTATGWAPKVGVRDGIGRLFHWLRDARKAPLVPVVVAAADLENSDGAGHKRPAPKLSPNGVSLRGREPRSKRMWRLTGVEAEPLESKIIKLP